MKVEIESLLTDRIVDEAIERFNLVKEKTNKVNSFENFIFESIWKGIPCILRLTHSSHRTIEQIKGEIDWIDYLVTNEAPVCQAFPSISGNYVERIPHQDSSYFLASIFRKADGLFLDKNKHLLTDTVIINWGKLVGKLHKLTKNYSPKTKDVNRPIWSDYVTNINEYLADDSIALQKVKEIVNKLESFPKDKDCFGLIHYDIHQANFLINDKEEINLFDFDDCEYSWFVADIAVILFTLIWFYLDKKSNKDEFCERFLGIFLKGYSQENILSTWWLNRISDFIRMRHILLYAVVIREHKLKPTEWSENIIKEWKPMIYNDIPYVKLKEL
ncbi:MAG: hypothetical protein EAX90_10510 [Candidatus Heimdallarchaeota archaeon]|nr:hypothetical protein [Candidatus Heimdallarchaeota archaeon]